MECLRRMTQQELAPGGQVPRGRVHHQLRPRDTILILPSSFIYDFLFVPSVTYWNSPAFLGSFFLFLEMLIVVRLLR